MAPVAELEQRVPSLRNLLVDSSKPLAERFRALFTLRNIDADISVEAIAACFEDDSALLKHECAYCLGQMQRAAALPLLSAVLENLDQDVMVRHEAAEALGAIGNMDAMPVLEKYLVDDAVEVRETCEIALDRLRSQQNNSDSAGKGPYLSVDPAPAPETSMTVEAMRELYLDTSKSLFERYRGLFGLRNDGTEEAVLAIVEGLRDNSALFRHEVAYVLGQMQHPASVPGLKERLEDAAENNMVRHECAEALGSIADERCLPLLQQYAKDSDTVVKDSCIVALDMHEHETSGAFQYADGVERVDGR